jgi:hypothetical protein
VPWSPPGHCSFVGRMSCDSHPSAAARRDLIAADGIQPRSANRMVLVEQSVRRAKRSCERPARKRRSRMDGALAVALLLMANEHGLQHASGKKAGVKRRYPPLTLEDPEPVSPTFAPLEQEHRLYPLAAWAWWHANDLAPAARRGLLVALARAWPVKGRRKSRHHRGFFAAMLKAADVDTPEIAKTLCVTNGEVEDLARDYWADWRRSVEVARGLGGSDTDPPRDPRPRIHADHREPFDPSTQLGAILSRQERPGNDDWQRVETYLQGLGYANLEEFLNTRG